jgi:hypothetical protein
MGRGKTTPTDLSRARVLGIFNDLEEEKFVRVLCLAGKAAWLLEGGAPPKACGETRGLSLAKIRR